MKSKLKVGVRVICIVEHTSYFVSSLCDTLAEIFSSSFAAAAYLEQNPLAPGKKVYVIGHEGICDELRLMNIPYLGGPEDAYKVADFTNKGVGVIHDKNVGAVVVGFDADINYYKIQYAQLCINENVGCKFIVTNCDSIAHLTANQEWAEAGAMVGAIKGIFFFEIYVCFQIISFCSCFLGS